MTMILDRLIGPLASLLYFITKQKEKRLGYTLEFPKLSHNWINAKVIFQMDEVWKREGLDAIGTNYFTIGSVKDGKSTRFDANSPYYQSWLGGYIVQFSSKREWGIEDHYRLGVADQKSWLRCYGKNAPEVSIDFDHIEDLGDIKLEQYIGKLYRGNIFSNTDVGTGSISLYHRLELSGLVHYFKKTNKNLDLKSNNLIPKWSKDHGLKSYEKIKLRGYIAIIEITDEIKAVLYANAAEYTDKNGVEHNNFHTLDKELLALIKSIEIKKV